MTGRTEPALKRGVDGVGQLRGVGDEDTARVGIVLGLGEQVGSHVLGVGARVSQDGDLGGAGLGVDTHHPHDGALGGGHVDVARAGDDINLLAQDLSPDVSTVGVVLGMGPVREHRDGLGASDGVDLGQAQQGAGRQDRGVGQSAELGLGRAGQGNLLDTGDLGGHGVHDHAGGVDGQSSGDIEPDAPDRHPTLGDGAAGNDLGRALGGHLSGVPGTVVGDGHLQGLAHRRVQVAECLVDGLGGHAEVNGAYAVEALGSVAQGGRAPGADVLNQRSHSGLSGGHIEGGPGKSLCQLAGAESGAAQISTGEHACKPTGHTRSCPGHLCDGALECGLRRPRTRRPGRNVLSQAA